MQYVSNFLTWINCFILCAKSPLSGLNFRSKWIMGSLGHASILQETAKVLKRRPMLKVAAVISVFSSQAPMSHTNLFINILFLRILPEDL